MSLGLLRGSREVIVPILIALFVAFLRDGRCDLELCGKDDRECVGAEWFLDAGQTGTITPLVQFPPQRIGLELQQAQFAGRKETVAAGSMDMGDGGVDDG